MDKVSIIVPVYQVAGYLPRMLDAILGQTHSDLEVLLVNDCSPDDSRGVMEAYAARDSRVVCLYQQQNRGVSAARNRGLDEMTGDWVCFCDGDDWYQPDYLEKMLRCAHEEGADFVICDYQLVSDGKKPIRAGAVDGLGSGCDLKTVIALGPISSWNHLIHRELLDRAGVRYPEGVRQYEELPVIPVLAKYARRVGILKEPLYNYYQRGDGTSASNAATDYRRNFEAAHSLMAQKLGPGYEREIEYHAIYALFYGEILLLCKQNAPRARILQALEALKRQYPDYRSNPYLPQMGRAKNLFLAAGEGKQVWAQRLFAKLHSLLVH